MKVIISHDIDHLSAFEHKDLLIPKFLIRATIELFLGVISFGEYIKRYKNIFILNKWQNLDELMKFNKQNQIPATFFIGVNSGLGLVYPLEKAKFWAKKIDNEGFDVGVHGIEFDNFEGIKKEYDRLYDIIKKPIGMRMHYLRNDEKTLNFLADAGYLYDSTTIGDKDPYKIKNMWEFPLHIMEMDLIFEDKRWQSQKFEVIKDKTKRRLDELFSKDLKYISILFHDRYFDDSFLSWKNWYIFTIEYIKQNGIEFISYKDAIKELESV